MAPVSSSEAAAGTKRSVVEEAPVMVSACGPVAGRPDKRPRFNESAVEQPRERNDGGSGPVAHAPNVKSIGGNIGDIDIMCRIASFINIGTDLLNICVSVGPKNANKIRNKYLLNNDAYLVEWLRALSIVPGMDWRIFYKCLKFFNKCRDCVISWMVVNKDWKKRCTQEKIEKYKRGRLPFDADVIFNNPVVAIEIGLVEVVRFLIEERRVDINASIWHGFNSDGFDPETSIFMKEPIDVAMVRGDVELLQYILSADGFDLARSVDEDGNVRDYSVETIQSWSEASYVSDESFRCLITHPNVDVNHYSGNRDFHSVQ